MQENTNLLKFITKFIDYLPQFISLLSGFFIAIFAEPLRQKLFKPILKIEFFNTADYSALTPERINNTLTEAYYIRIKVTNIKKVVAKNCKVFLVNVEEGDENGNIQQTLYCDRIPLPWSCQNIGEQYNDISLNYKESHFADVVTTRKDSPHIFPQIKVSPFRYDAIFQKKGVFIFTVQVTVSNAEPKNIKLMFSWDGKWDKFIVDKLE